VEAHLGEVVVVDPRRRMRYLSGHLPGAVNLPAPTLLDGRGRLRPPEELGGRLGEAGVPSDRTVVVADSFDGQMGGTVAWVLAYLGHPDVRVLDATFEAWKAQGREVRYRPAPPRPARFAPRPRPELRATWDQVLDAVRSPAGPAPAVLDVRSEEEFAGAGGEGVPPGHVPGARNVPWLRLVSREGPLLAGAEAVRSALSEAGVPPEGPSIVYCLRGPRAAVAFVALAAAGHPARVYFDSWADWVTHPEAPVER
jgi:thiosulfate/3-mercaptopyruvate sulfurtransferase